MDVFKPQTGEVISDNADGIAYTDYNEESFFVRHAYFLGANDPYSALKTTLTAEIDPEAWATLYSDTSRPFDKPTKGRIAVKAAQSNVGRMIDQRPIFCGAGAGNAHGTHGLAHVPGQRGGPFRLDCSRQRRW